MKFLVTLTPRELAALAISAIEDRCGFEVETFSIEPVPSEPGASWQNWYSADEIEKLRECIPPQFRRKDT